MAEERKQIIEILEPYMEKTLSEGCLIETTAKIVFNCCIDKNYNIIFTIGKDGIENKNRGYIKLGDKYFSYESISQSRLINLIGHYDLSAVLKYIENNYKKIQSPHKIEVSIEYIHILGLGKEIPNKPLHLYTQEEEINLLKLLKELGKQ